MGTRAAFWIGDPRELDSREWLGCKAFDGYPGNEDFAEVLKATTADEFRAAVAELAKEKDFARPSGGWPYPWSDDVFLTDYTYAFFVRETRVTCFHHGFVPGWKALSEDFEWEDRDDPSLLSVPSGKPYDRDQPDTIMIISVPNNGGT